MEMNTDILHEFASDLLAAQPVQPAEVVRQYRMLSHKDKLVWTDLVDGSGVEPILMQQPALYEFRTLFARPVQQPAAVAGQEPIGYAPTYLTERLDAGDSGVMLTVTRKPLPGHGVTVALYTAPVPAAGVQGDAAQPLVKCDECEGKGSVMTDEGYPGDGFMQPPDGPTIEACPVCEGKGEHNLMPIGQPDSGRDAALAEIVREVHAKPQTAVERANLFDRIGQRLAAHPAPSSDAALVQALVQAMLVLDKAIHQVLIAGGDYGDDLSDTGLREKLKQAQLAAYPALIAAGVEKADYSVNPFSVFVDRDAPTPPTTGAA